MNSKRVREAEFKKPLSPTMLDEFVEPHLLSTCNHIDNYKVLMACIQDGNIKCPICRQLTPYDQIIPVKGLDGYEKPPETALFSQIAVLEAENTLLNQKIKVLNLVQSINQCRHEEKKPSHQIIENAKHKLFQSSQEKSFQDSLNNINNVKLQLELERKGTLIAATLIGSVIKIKAKKNLKVYQAIQNKLQQEKQLANKKFEEFSIQITATIQSLNMLNLPEEFLKTANRIYKLVSMQVDTLQSFKPIRLELQKEYIKRFFKNTEFKNLLKWYHHWVAQITKLASLDQQKRNCLQEENYLLAEKLGIEQVYRVPSNITTPEKTLVHLYSNFNTKNVMNRTDLKEEKKLDIQPTPLNESKSQYNVELFDELQQEFFILLQSCAPEIVNEFLLRVESLGNNLKSKLLEEKMIIDEEVIFTPLDIAIQQLKNKDMISVLLIHGADPNNFSTTEDTSSTPLSYIATQLDQCHKQHDSIKHNCQCQTHIEIAKLLIEHHADINLLIGPSKTHLLKFAISSGKVEFTKYLILHNNDLNKLRAITNEFLEDKNNKISKQHYFAIRNALLEKISELESPELKNSPPYVSRVNRKLNIKTKESSLFNIDLQIIKASLEEKKECYIQQYAADYKCYLQLPQKIESIKQHIKQANSEFLQKMAHINFQVNLNTGSQIEKQLYLLEEYKNFIQKFEETIQQSLQHQVNLEQQYTALKNRFNPVSRLDEKIKQVEIKIQMTQEQKNQLKKQQLKYSFAIWKKHTQDAKRDEKLFIAIKNHDLKQIKNLHAKQHINVNAIDKTGSPALIIAIQHSNAETVKLLIQLGANLHQEDSNHKKPLDWAIEKAQKDYKYMEIINLISNRNKPR